MAATQTEVVAPVGLQPAPHTGLATKSQVAVSFVDDDPQQVSLQGRVGVFPARAFSGLQMKMAAGMATDLLRVIVDDIPPTFEDIHAGTERWLGAAKR